MNPEIITRHDANQMTQSLRFGAGYRAGDARPPLLSWPAAFTDEIEKCHGCSKCTTVTTATRMCPVYKITRDEAATPKAKANVLRALISGRIENRFIYDVQFQNVIRLCIHCSSCYQECPSNVNIPKMALEARARYIRRFGPSFHDRIVVNAELAGRTTRKFSHLLKSMAELAPVAKIGERFAGISAHRDVIAFSKRSLREQVPERMGSGAEKVLYFAGCYASYIEPNIGLSAIKILNQMDMTVLTPEQHCCGLPLLSKGMVDGARDKITQNIHRWGALAGEAAAIVVTCSSCGLSLMQEWGDLLGKGAVRKIQEKIVHISRLVLQYRHRLRFKPADLKVTYHHPCHLKVQPESDSSVRMLSEISGITVAELETHCCGMAGSWGLASEHYSLSRQIGQDMIDKLNASPGTVGVTDCPTCRIQMAQFSRMPIRHPVEIVADFL